VADTLAERNERIGKDLALRFAGIVEKSVAVMEVVGRTYEVPRDNDGFLVRPDGMSESEFNLHCDAMLPGNKVPFYLQCDRARVELAHRLAGERANAPSKIAELVVRVLERAPVEYPIIDVKVTKKE
jgi:hypothetical protein